MTTRPVYRKPYEVWTRAPRCKLKLSYRPAKANQRTGAAATRVDNAC